jgi:hypothetical protein
MNERQHNSTDIGTSSITGLTNPLEDFVSGHGEHHFPIFMLEQPRTVQQEEFVLPEGINVDIIFFADPVPPTEQGPVQEAPGI